MKEIAIFGGTFDPITNAHLDIARFIRDTYNLDILFLPTKNTRWKDGISDANHRLNMLKLAIKDETRMSICEEEINNVSNDKNYTIDTILALSDSYKGYKLYYIIGSDQLEKLDKWINIDDLSKLVTFLVIERQDYPINQDNLIIYDCIDTKHKMEDISSTKIRNYESTDTKKDVLDYIYKTGIYASNLMFKLVDKDRYEHCLRVASLAKRIAKFNSYDESKAYYCGLIHDCAKRISHEKTIEYMLKYSPDNINESYGLYHQYIGDVIAKEYFHVTDQEILDAIKCHTTGRMNMTTLDKIIYCADKLEEGRDYDTSKAIELCKLDINYGFAKEFINNIDYVKNVKHLSINEISNNLYNESKEYIEKFEIQTLYKTIDDKLGLDITIYDTKQLNTISNYTIVASAASERQLLAISQEIKDIVEKYDFDFHHCEDQYKSGWVLIDLCDIIIHIFKGNIREEYGIDENLKNCNKINIGEN